MNKNEDFLQKNSKKMTILYRIIVRSYFSALQETFQIDKKIKSMIYLIYEKAR